MKLMCPSLVCTNWDHIEDEIKKLDEAGSDIYHVDIMDGEFVPEFALGMKDLKTIRANTSKLIDVHLMIMNPLHKIQWFIEAGADIIYIHPESERFVIRTLQKIREYGKYAGIAISPDWSVESVREMLPYCDYVMIVAVNPGTRGYAFMHSLLSKIETILHLKEKYGYKVIIDGGCSEEVIQNLSKKGADGFVLGTSVLFNKDEDYKTIIKRLKEYN